jgi:ribonuclease P protein component
VATLPRSQRLRSEKQIAGLFGKKSEAKHVFSYPFKVVFLLPDSPETALEWPQILVSVSKKPFKKAVDRNLLKRRIREAYRQHKYLLQTSNAEAMKPWCLAFLYVGKVIEPYDLIEKKMKLLLQTKVHSGV